MTIRDPGLCEICMQPLSPGERGFDRGLPPVVVSGLQLVPVRKPITRHPLLKDCVRALSEAVKRVVNASGD
jgi:hypothetical protein